MYNGSRGRAGNQKCGYSRMVSVEMMVMLVAMIMSMVVGMWYWRACVKSGSCNKYCGHKRERNVQIATMFQKAESKNKNSAQP